MSASTYLRFLTQSVKNNEFIFFDNDNCRNNSGNQYNKCVFWRK